MECFSRNLSDIIQEFATISNGLRTMKVEETRKCHQVKTFLIKLSWLAIDKLDNILHNFNAILHYKNKLRKKRIEIRKEIWNHFRR